MPPAHQEISPHQEKLRQQPHIPAGEARKRRVLIGAEHIRQHGKQRKTNREAVRAGMPVPCPAPPDFPRKMSPAPPADAGQGSAGQPQQQEDHGHAPEKEIFRVGQHIEAVPHIKRQRRKNRQQICGRNRLLKSCVLRLHLSHPPALLPKKGGGKMTFLLLS